MGACLHSHLIHESGVSVGGERLGEDVGHHVVGANVGQDDSAGFHLLSDVVVLDVDVLAALVVLRVLAECDSTLAV